MEIACKNNSIELKEITKIKNKIIFNYTTSGEICQYFSDKPFWIEYPENIESVPDSILAVPFVCNVLPIVWLTDSTLVISELDEAFFNCLPDVKKGYETMYPETEWKGNIEVGKIVPCDREAEQGKCAMFYSGGVDSVQTLISHLDEKPTLISIWGSDVKVDNTEGWNVLFKAISEASERFQLPTATIRSTFREFDNEGLLDRDFHEKLLDGWWHGVKHGIALLGHVAPLAYLYGLSNMYIASSNFPELGAVRCASDPIIDNSVRFCNCQVYHDGYEYTRQDKIRNIVNYNNGNKPIVLHVCWETQTGHNCCKCEKCYRTICGLLIQNADPKKYGFYEYESTIADMHSSVLNGGRISPLIAQSEWMPMKKAAKKNLTELKKNKYYSSIKWILTTDFEHPETIRLPLSLRLKQAKGIRGKLAEFKFYQQLHRVKESLVKRNK